MSGGFSTRPATAEDLPAIARFWRRSVISTGVTYEKDDTEADLLAKLETHFPDEWTVDVAESESTPIAFLALDKREPVLAQLFVDPEHQGRGLGLAFLNQTKAAFPEGFTLWTDERNAGSRRFYEREGLTLESLVKHPVASHYRAHYRWAPAHPGDH